MMQEVDKDSFPGRQKSRSKRFLSVLGLFMFSFYFILGLLIVFWRDFPIEIAPSYRMLFGAALIVYSFFRFIRLWQQRK